jgi:hypothetical protein
MQYEYVLHSDASRKVVCFVAPLSAGMPFAGPETALMLTIAGEVGAEVIRSDIARSCAS